MYKTRINRWEIGKNLKGAEMEAIIRKQAERSFEGKKSVFYLHNSRVPEAKIARYRKALKVASKEQALRLRATTPPELRCFTPLVAPLRTPQEYEVPERIAKLSQVYVCGAFDSNIWTCNEEHRDIGAHVISSCLLTFCRGWFHASWGFQGRSQNAWRVLNIAMSHAEEIVKVEDPLTIKFLFEAVSKLLATTNLIEIAIAILTQFSNMSARIKSRGHPYTQLFTLFAGLGRDGVDDIYHMRIARQSVLDCFAQYQDRHSRTMLELQISSLNWEEKDSLTEKY